jgi:YD repeat-containing protein
VNVTIGETSFDHVYYDRGADVLYLHVGDPSTAVSFDESPEGHALRYDADSRLVGITVVGARALLDRDGAIVVTPSQLRLEARELEPVLAA